MFTLQLLIDEKLLTQIKFKTLKEKAGNLKFHDANHMMKV